MWGEGDTPAEEGITRITTGKSFGGYWTRGADCSKALISFQETVLQEISISED